MTDFDITDVFEEFEKDYTRTRYVITNTYQGETKVPSTATVSAYIHPDDYKKDVYNAQGQRLEARVKIFVKLDVDLLPNDEIEYQGESYKVFADNKKVVGNYKKLLGELIA